MLDFLTALWGEHQFWTMFVSAFLSATVLPGNSEIVFLGLAAKIQLPEQVYFSHDILWLLFSATSGNTLGSLTTYWLGRWFPSPDWQANSPKVRWVLRQIQRYGAWSLLLSWLPVVGDLFCAVAGWLRLNSWHAFMFILLSKFLRYFFLLHLVIGYTFL